MRQRGFSLVEMVVVLAIAGVLLALGLDAFTTMMASNRSRSAAESIASGLQRARAEAIGRNAPMRFQLVNDLTSSCDYSVASTLWAVTQTDQVAPHGLVKDGCNAAPYIPTNACLLGLGACTDDVWLAFKSPSSGFPGIIITACTAKAATGTPDCNGTGASIVTFGPIGQVLANIAAAPTLGYVLADPTAAVAGAKRWAVRINTVNGGIKLCDPDLDSAASPSPPLAC